MLVPSLSTVIQYTGLVFVGKRGKPELGLYYCAEPSLLLDNSALFALGYFRRIYCEPMEEMIGIGVQIRVLVIEDIPLLRYEYVPLFEIHQT